MADNNIIPITMFGSYSITGELLLLANCTMKGVASNLYYNQSSKTYFLVKEFASGKYHIDFFSKTRKHELDYIFNPDNCSFKYIADYNSKDGNIIKKLIYCNKSKTYIINTYQNEQTFKLILAKNSLFFDDTYDIFP